MCLTCFLERKLDPSKVKQISDREIIDQSNLLISKNNALIAKLQRRNETLQDIANKVASCDQFEIQKEFAANAKQLTQVYLTDKNELEDVM